MVKLVILIKRRPDLSVKEFKARYERHAPLALSYLKDVLIDYRRNYPVKEYSYVSADSAVGELLFEYDVVTEMRLRSSEDLDKMFQILADPEVEKVIRADEDTFLDRESIRVLVCEEER